MRAVILAGGPITPTAALRARCEGAGLVIAADSGLRHAAPLGLLPDLIVGDFDSVRAADLARYPEVPRVRHPPEKDALDLELALEEALTRGARELLVVGGLGGRFDQSLAAVLIGARLSAQVPIAFHSGHIELLFLRGEDARTLERPVGERFSVLSLAPLSRLGISGAKYPLRDVPLPFGVGLGVSNEVVACPLRLELSEGLVVVILEGL